MASETSVQDLFRRAVHDDDENAMREAVIRLFAHGGPEALSPEAEYLLRHEDYVMEMPQSGERIRGRDSMRAMQAAFPVPPSISLRRVFGSGRVWVVEGINDYAGDLWHVVVLLELDTDGLIRRDTRYYTQRSEPPAWRAQWVEQI